MAHSWGGVWLLWRNDNAHLAGSVTFLFSDCGVSAVGEGARLPVTQPSYIVLVLTETLLLLFTFHLKEKMVIIIYAT